MHIRAYTCMHVYVYHMYMCMYIYVYNTNICSHFGSRLRRLVCNAGRYRT